MVVKLHNHNCGIMLEEIFPRSLSDSFSRFTGGLGNHVLRVIKNLQSYLMQFYKKKYKYY